MLPSEAWVEVGCEEVWSIFGEYAEVDWLRTNTSDMHLTGYALLYRLGQSQGQKSQDKDISNMFWPCQDLPLMSAQNFVIVKKTSICFH
jgi:hypothetical protein